MNPIAELNTINTLITTCLQQHYAGIQMDFELVALNDREKLSLLSSNY